MKEHLDRKTFFLKCGLLATGGWLLAGCSDNSDRATKSPEVKGKDLAKDSTTNNPTDCNDLRGISQAELAKRKSLGYVKEAPSPEVRCELCKLYLPASGGKNCGFCSLFQGPVATGASCTYFAPLSEGEG